MVDINYDEQIIHQQNKVKEIDTELESLKARFDFQQATKIKILGAIEMLTLLKAEAERKVEAVVTEVKQEACKLEEKVEAVEADIVGK